MDSLMEPLQLIPLLHVASAWFQDLTLAPGADPD